MREREYDIAIIGSGAGGGTVAQELAPLCRDGVRIVVLEKGPRLRDDEFSGREVEMAQALYEDGGGFLTADGSLTLAMGCGYGGSTTVYTGTSIAAPQRVIESWNVPGLGYEEVMRRTRKFIEQNNVHYLDEERINENNQLFVEGCRRLGYDVEQFPINVRGCRGSSLCNLGCPNRAKQGTDRVQLPRAERDGVEVVTRCEVTRLESRSVVARVTSKPEGGKGEPSPWEAGEYRIRAKVVVACAGAVNSPALLLRSRLPARLPRLGHGFTSHPALILVAEHGRSISNFVGHPKSYYLDQFVESEGFILETCMYFPFTTAKSLRGFGAPHSAFMRAFPRLQMILVLACDHVDPANRVTVDRRGRPVVHYRCTPAVKKALARGTLAAARIFFAAGARRVHVPAATQTTVEREDAERLEEIIDERYFRPGGVSVSAAHLQGGCVMGLTADDSVTDSYGRVHGVPWLFVADASLFPDAIEINPYLTIMALADRVAQRIRQDTGTLLS
ncbi:MAG: GMC family oxidoreductase [Gemmatimonadales bacterium]|jgi:choline dehydrogenase-like flavoprotein